MARLQRNEFHNGSLLAAAILAAVIIYGSLYPFAFRYPVNGAGPIPALFESWAQMPRRGDFVANILFYLPFGFFGLLAITANGRLLPSILMTTVAGLLLSTAMELAQYYIPGRITAADDVYANAAGTALGAALGGISRSISRWPVISVIAANRVPCLLLALWLGCRLFPYVPAVDLPHYWGASRPAFLYPSAAGFEFLSHTAIWLTAGALIEAIGRQKPARLLFPLFIGGVVAAEVMIAGKAWDIAEIAGGGLALGLWLLLAVGAGPQFRAAVIALLLWAAVIAERLAPFRFGGHARHFNWLPFLGLMRGALETNIMSFFEKALLYGSLIWLFHKTGVGFWTSVILVSMILVATSWAQIYLGAGSAETTDALIALIIGAALVLIGSETERSSQAPVAKRR